MQFQLAGTSYFWERPTFLLGYLIDGGTLRNNYRSPRSDTNTVRTVFARILSPVQIVRLSDAHIFVDTHFKAREAGSPGLGSRLENEFLGPVSVPGNSTV